MLVLLHGFTHTGASWDGVIAALGERYRVLAPDIRGHGEASTVEPVSLQGVIDDVGALVGDAPFALVGYSMGARLALHVALAMPGQVERLVLVGGSPGIADADEREARRRADEELAAEMERLEIDELANRWASDTAVLGGQPPDVAKAAHRDRLRNSPAGLARALRGLGTGTLPSLWERLGELRMPVKLIVGERDIKFRVLANQVAPLLGGPVEVVTVPGAGHAVHLEAAAAVADASTR